MISQKKAADWEQAYRNLLFRRPVGIFSVLFTLLIVTFSAGIALSAAKVTFPFFMIYGGIFALIILAVATHWLLQGFALVRRKEWSGIIGILLGGAAFYFGMRFLIVALLRF